MATQYSDPYEEWKNNKKGMSYEDWGKQQAAPQQPQQSQAQPQQSSPYGGYNPYATNPYTGTTPNWGGNTGTGSDAAVAAGGSAYSSGQRGADPSKIPGYEDMDAWRQWYAAQQGGERPEDMARYSGQTLAGWDPWLIKEGANAGKYRSMRGAEGYFDKPTECPPGYSPSGPNEDDPCIPNGQARGGGGRGSGGAGGGGGRGGGGYSGSGNPIFDYLKSSGLDAASDPEKALSAFMGYGGAGGYQAQIDAARREAESLPPGPARDAAIARLSELKTTGLSSMRQAAAAAARGDLTGMLGTEQGYAQLAENARQANMQNKLGWGGLDLQRELGLGNLGLARDQFGWQSGQQWKDILAGQQADRDLQTRLTQMGLKANQPSTLQKILGTIGGISGIAGSLFGAGGLFGGKK